MTTYYVDSVVGSNQNDGLNQSSAWKTIPRVNVVDLHPGDSVLFNRGQVFGNYVLQPPNDGICGNLITFGAYGTGENPIIDGLFRVSCVDIRDRHYLAFEDIECRNGKGGGIVVIDNSTNITFTNCNVHNCENDNLRFIDGVTNCVVAGGLFYNAIDIGGGVIATGIEIADNCEDITLNNVNCYDNPHVGLSIHSHVTSLMPRNITINNSTFDTGSIGAFQSAKQDDSDTVDLFITFNNCIFNGLVEIAVIGDVDRPSGYRFANCDIRDIKVL